MMGITLKWNGPLKIPQVKGDRALPSNEEECKEAGLLNPGVYIYYLEYPDFFVIYAGKTGDLLKRVQEHFSGHLGMQYSLRIPKPARRPDNIPSKLKWEADHKGYKWSSEYEYINDGYSHLSPFNDLKNNLENAKREAKKIVFFYCPYRENEKRASYGVAKKEKLSSAEFNKWAEGFLVYYLKINQWKTNIFSEADRKINKPWFCDNAIWPVSKWRLDINFGSKDGPPDQLRGLKLISGDCKHKFLQELFSGEHPPSIGNQK